MRGQVLGVDRTSGEGQISGEDGHRYTFRPDDWSDAKGPAVGARIDFAIEGSRALRIFRLPDSDVASVGAVRRPPTIATNMSPLCSLSSSACSASTASISAATAPRC